jgi:hypothetical protein
MADKKTQMDKTNREAYVKAQANKDEDRLTQADLEKKNAKNLLKKIEAKFFLLKTDQKTCIGDTGIYA